MHRTDEIVIDFADGSRLRRPERDELTWAAQERVSAEHPWLCVLRGDQLYIQAYRHGPEAWQVEHRFGSSDGHHQAVGHQTWAVTEQLLWGWTAVEPGWQGLVEWQKLDFPARQVPVAHEPHARTRWIGTHEDGQFFGDVTGASGLACTMALLHRFDPEGNHLGTDFRPTADVDTAERELAQLLDGLRGVTYGSIRIRPFAVDAHGLRWGLIDGTAERDGLEHYELMPQQLGFGEPFNGLYCT
ncbi:hypothetical protein [Kitasatospora sp. MBT63]|uniref:hypothetical protein n=1 Tax=Kitasatospora sp. MBT63 TaxID=1444768 RepID=UPI0011EA67D8|nr:hypothetical protein [Kitasatospora sp. MBT63]